MRAVLRLTLMLAIAGAASTAHALESGDWDALEDTAQYSLEYAQTEEAIPWVNPDSGTEGTFTPVTTYEGPEGQVCREYAVDAIIDGREEVVYGTACRLKSSTGLRVVFRMAAGSRRTPSTVKRSHPQPRPRCTRVSTGRGSSGTSRFLADTVRAVFAWAADSAPTIRVGITPGASASTTGITVGGATTTRTTVTDTTTATTTVTRTAVATSATIGTNTEATIRVDTGRPIGVAAMIVTRAGTGTTTALETRSERTRAIAELSATSRQIHDRGIANRETSVTRAIDREVAARETSAAREIGR